MKCRFCISVLLAVVFVSLVSPSQLATGSGSIANRPHRKIMIVGVAHLVAQSDLHNFSFDDPLSPKRQKEIAEFIQRLVAFHPTKVMVEAALGDPKVSEKYHQYLKGSYQLDANEIYQFGFRLAALSKDPEVYPIDTKLGDFPFDYDSVRQSADRNHQSAILAEAEASTSPLRKHQQQLIENGSILELVRFLNSEEAIKINAGWYSFQDRIGSGDDYSGAELVSIWYARNLFLFANIMRLADAPDDRVVIFIGAGHVKLLRDCVELSPDLEFVDPEQFLGEVSGAH